MCTCNNSEEQSLIMLQRHRTRASGEEYKTKRLEEKEFRKQAYEKCV